jgi:hypothetical protein
MYYFIMCNSPTLESFLLKSIERNLSTRYFMEVRGEIRLFIIRELLLVRKVSTMAEPHQVTINKKPKAEFQPMPV